MLAALRLRAADVSEDERIIRCPYCGERFAALLEADEAAEQVLDCAVCCRPIHMQADGRAQREDET